MGSRLDLHKKLVQILPSAYFQPPSNIQLVYPCIIYNKTGKDRKLANDGIYLSMQEYQIMVIEKNPDSTVADTIENTFQHCRIDRSYTVENLNHTTLTLFY